MAQQAKKVKAPFRYMAEGNLFRLYEYGRKTSKTFKSEQAAKKFVLEGNAPYRKSGERALVPLVKNAGTMARIRAAKKYDKPASKVKYTAAMKGDLNYLIERWKTDLELLADQIATADYDEEYDEARRLTAMYKAHSRRKPTMADVIRLHKAGIPVSYANPRKRRR